MARNKYPEITVERILNAAQRLFLEHGGHSHNGNSIEEICRDMRRPLSGINQTDVGGSRAWKNKLMTCLYNHPFLNIEYKGLGNAPSLCSLLYQMKSKKRGTKGIVFGDT